MISRLSNASSVSGNETEVRNIILSSINNPLFDIKCDKTGNIIVEYTAEENKPYILLVAHMDECGFMVTDITDDGYIGFDLIGDADTKSIVSKRVKANDINGVISIKAVHLVDKEEKKKDINIKDLYIDIGAKTKEEALKYVTKGDLFAFSNEFKTLNNKMYLGKSLSRSISCTLLTEFINELKGGDINIVCVFSVLKEVGGRGLKTALNSLKDIEYAIVIDSVDADKYSKAVIGITKDSSEETISVAEKICKISDREYEYITDKSNADVIPADIPAILLGIPCKGMKTNVNMMSAEDTNDAKMLLNSITAEVY